MKKYEIILRAAAILVLMMCCLPLTALALSEAGTEAVSGFVPDGQALIQTASAVVEAEQETAAVLYAEDTEEPLAAGTCGTGVSWQLSRDGVLTISGTGDMTDYSDDGIGRLPLAPWAAYKEQITSVVVEEGVTGLGTYAFANCANMKSIRIADSVIFDAYDYYIFYNCTGLEQVKLPKNITLVPMYAFYGCTGLKSIEIPSGVKTIGYAVFYGCSGLETVVVPESVAWVGEWAFYGCSALSAVEYQGSEASWASVYVAPNNGPLWEAVNMPYHECGYFGSYRWTLTGGKLVITGSGAMDEIENTVDFWTPYAEEITSVEFAGEPANIGRAAFYECVNLTEITIPDSVASIDPFAFYGCKKLPEIAIPGSVTTIGKYAFYECVALTDVTIPEGVTTIGEEAFNQCIGMKTVCFPSSLTEIGEFAFSWCPKLESVYYTGTEEQWEEKVSIGARNDCLETVIYHFVPAPLVGDVNADGAVNVQDLVALMKYLVGAEGALVVTAADVNASGGINLLDMIHLMQRLAEAG